MEVARSEDNPLGALHAELNLPMLSETDRVLRLLQGLDPLILQELDDLIECEGGLLIP
jgi:hypothetical protein